MKEEIEQAISICQREGIKLPEMKTDEEKEAWYEKFMSEGERFGGEIL